MRFQPLASEANVGAAVDVSGQPPVNAE